MGSFRLILLLTERTLVAIRPVLELEAQGTHDEIPSAQPPACTGRRDRVQFTFRASLARRQ